MKKLLIISACFLCGVALAQGTTTEPDTTRVKVGKNTEILIINRGDYIDSIDVALDTIDAGPKEPRRKNEAHWSGLDFGMNVNLNASGTDKFDNYTFLENDPLQSFYFNVNFAEKKIKIIKEYVGLTTGVGFNFNQIGFKDNVVISETVDTLVGNVSSIDFSKNKLRVAYVQIPLILEFNTNKENDKGVYLGVGVIGGVKLASRTKRVYNDNGEKVKEKIKGTYALEPFKLDATARIGFDNWGAFVNYSVMPLFDTDKTAAVHPVSFGLSYSF